MAERENKALVTRLYEQAWGGGDITVVDEVFSPRHVLHWNEGAPTVQQRAAEDVKSIIRDYRAAFPDLAVTIDNIVADGDTVAVQVTFVGTHRNTYEGFAPTNKKSWFTDMQILRFADGKIVESFLGSGGLKYFYSILDGSIFRA